MNTSKMKEDVSNVFMAVSGEATDATKQKVTSTGMKLRVALKRVSTQMEMLSQAPVSRFQV